MTAETLQDAIGLLPADLIAETDRIRTRKRKIIPWKRYAAMAASFAIVLACGRFAMEFLTPKGATESIPQAPAAAAPLAPVMDESAAEEAAPEEFTALNKGTGTPEAEPEGYFFCDERTFAVPLAPGLSMDSVQSTLFQSRDQLEAFLSRAPELSGFSEILEFYDESWFEYQDLILLRLPSEKSEYRPAVSALTNPYPQWQFTIRWENTPEDNTLDPVLWYLFVGVCRDSISPEDTILTIADPQP